MKKKLTLKDVKIIGEGTQIKKAILQRYSSIEDFYEQHKVTNSFKTFTNYLSQEAITSDTFKCRITRILDVDYPSLFVPASKQIEAHVIDIYDNINLYEEEEDLAVFDYLFSKFEKEKNMSREIAMMYRASARVYYDTNLFKHCREYYKYAIDTLSNEDINYKVFFHCELAYDMVKELMYEEAEKKFILIEKLINLHRKNLNSSTMHHYYYWKGIMYRKRGSNSIAINLFNKALEAAENNLQKLNALSNIALAHKNTKQYDEALEYYNKALGYHDEARILATSVVYNNIASLYKAVKDYDNAIINIDKAFDMSKDECTLSKLLIFTSTRAEIKMEIGDEEAYKEFFKVLLSSKGKAIHEKSQVLAIIKAFVTQLNNIPCLEEYADIIMEIKDTSNNDAYKDGLSKCMGCVLEKLRKLKRGLYNEKA